VITSLNTVSLYVTDQQKALDFYVGTLGFELRREADMGPMGRWLEVAPQGADRADAGQGRWLRQAGPGR
jgi:lactoylglutathione lyase